MLEKEKKENNWQKKDFFKGNFMAASKTGNPKKENCSKKEFYGNRKGNAWKKRKVKRIFMATGGNNSAKKA